MQPIPSKSTPKSKRDVDPTNLTAAEWNARYPICTKVVLTLANGKRRVTRTASRAETWGARHHVRVDAIEHGYVLLEWVRPFLPATSRT